ncbi:hypothetical protein BDV28DRAFT_126411 [Aspergillus coremiiformis]|uniref:Uncharacterized protein n=1 Tax=Aspergillus coremiiformis TaxID=138285 RepID=A0A5N6ZI72_9EURO|nr:hypothetical protein BDV28DRAFT_126411 [Aspergillus coremiiformis]
MCTRSLGAIRQATRRLQRLLGILITIFSCGVAHTLCNPDRHHPSAEGSKCKLQYGATRS